jgi:hypothetical protein
VSCIPLFRGFAQQKSHFPPGSVLRPVKEYLACNVQQSQHLILEKQDPQNFHPTRRVVNQKHQRSQRIQVGIGVDLRIINIEFLAPDQLLLLALFHNRIIEAPELLSAINTFAQSRYSASGKERWARGGTRTFCRWVVKSRALKPISKARGCRLRTLPLG